MDIDSISFLDIRPTQFYLSEEKMERIKQWFDPSDLSNFEPIPIKELNGRIIFTDGHTRAWVAYQAGLTHIPLVWDEDELDWEAYQIDVDACEERKIHTICDLKDRIISAAEYRQKWNGWCDEMQAELKRKRMLAAGFENPIGEKK